MCGGFEPVNGAGFGVELREGVAQEAGVERRRRRAIEGRAEPGLGLASDRRSGDEYLFPRHRAEWCLLVNEFDRVPGCRQPDRRGWNRDSHRFADL